MEIVYQLPLLSVLHALAIYYSNLAIYTRIHSI